MSDAELWKSGMVAVQIGTDWVRSNAGDYPRYHFRGFLETRGCSTDDGEMVDGAAFANSEDCHISSLGSRQLLEW